MYQSKMKKKTLNNFKHDIHQRFVQVYACDKGILVYKKKVMW